MHHGNVWQEGRRQGREGDAREEGRHAEERPLGQESDEQEAGDRDWAVGSSQRRRQSSGKEGLEKRIKEAVVEEGIYEEALLEETIYQEAFVEEVS